MDSLSLVGSLNEQDISVHRQISIDGDNKGKGRYLAILISYLNTAQYMCKQVTACVLWQGRKLGFTCYDVDTSYLYCMPDVAETEDFGYLSRGNLLCVAG